MKQQIFGLTHKQVEANRKQFGVNELEGEKQDSFLKIFFMQFNDLMIYLLGGATVASAFMGDYVESVTITAIILLNGVLGFVQEYRTSKTLEKLKVMAAPNANVIREGVQVVLPARDIVVGDIFVLEAGEKVPADAKVVQAFGLQVDESLLTGESVPVAKSVGNDVSMGTIVTGGRAFAEVTNVGMNTSMGKIAGMLQNTEKSETPIQQMLNSLGKVIVAGCLLICAGVVAMGIFRGEDPLNMILSGISLAVAAVPEGMPAIVTVALAIGVRRMLVKKVLIRRLPAVETLGCATVICSDKTGTITQNRMSVREMFVNGNAIELNSDNVLATDVLRLAFNCCTFQIVKKRRAFGTPNNKTISCIDPTEQAIVDLANKLKLNIWDEFEDRQLVYEFPFNSIDKRMTVVCKLPNNRYVAVMKGAPDVVLNLCDKVKTRKSDSVFGESQRRLVYSANEQMANKALRVIAVAYKYIDKWDYNTDLIERNKDRFNDFKNFLESNMTFGGLIGIMDPPKREAKAAVSTCRSAGVRVIMITGDHKSTAGAIAAEIGITTPEIITGVELDAMTEQQMATAVRRANVFARVSPKHKLSIVRQLKQDNQVVAMTGDGVNDAPAVGEADIGVAMGKHGTDVTREAASMVLLDDNFASITEAILQGRVIFGNIRKFIRYLLACNIGEVLSMALTMLLGLPLPLLPIHILFVNLVTDGLPALALGCEPADKDVMTRKPRRKDASIFADGLGALIVIRGILIGAWTVGIFAFVYWKWQALDVARTCALVMLIQSQLMHVFECKSENKSLLKINIFNNIWLILAAATSLMVTIAIVTLPICNKIFATVPLSTEIWQLLLWATLALPVVGGAITKLYQLIAVSVAKRKAI